MSPITNLMQDAYRRQNQRTEHRRRIIFIVVIAFLLLIASFVAFGLLGSNGNWFDKSAQKGIYVGHSEAEIQEALAKEVEEGMMAISVSTIIRFPNGSRNPGTANIVNLPTNHVDQKVSIQLVSTGETVYESAAIAPGYTIENIRLNRQLAAGTYDALALFTGYNTETHEAQGSIGAEVKIVVS